MAFKVVLDANVLYPSSLRDTLLRLAHHELYDLALSERILDEATRNLVADQRVDPAQAERLRQAIASVFPEAMVDPAAIAAVEPAMTNDPGDRHVLAAAVVSGAEGIVTFNARHFPDAALAPFGKQRIDPDDFLCTPRHRPAHGHRIAHRAGRSAQTTSAVASATPRLPGARPGR